MPECVARWPLTKFALTSGSDWTSWFLVYFVLVCHMGEFLPGRSLSELFPCFTVLSVGGVNNLGYVKSFCVPLGPLLSALTGQPHLAPADVVLTR